MNVFVSQPGQVTIFKGLVPSLMVIQSNTTPKSDNPFFTGQKSR